MQESKTKNKSNTVAKLLSFSKVSVTQRECHFSLAKQDRVDNMHQKKHFKQWSSAKTHKEKTKAPTFHAKSRLIQKNNKYFHFSA